MKKQKHENITLSIPSDLNALLHFKISSRGISKFVAEVVRKALEEEEKKELLNLESAYKAAERDKGRKAVIDEWKPLDEIDDVKGWEW